MIVVRSHGPRSLRRAAAGLLLAAGGLPPPVAAGGALPAALLAPDSAAVETAPPPVGSPALSDSLLPGTPGAEGGRPSRLPPAPARAGAALVREDRLRHASLAFAVGLAAGVLTEEPAAAFGGAAGLGLAKEVADRRHGGFDLYDLWAGLAGAALAALATRALTR